MFLEHLPEWKVCQQFGQLEMCQEKHHSLSGSIICNTSDRFLPREMGKKKSKLLEHKRQENLLDFRSSHCLCPQNSCAITPAQHFEQSSVTVSDLGTCTGESRKPETQLLCARPLETGDCPVSHHHPWGLCREQKQPCFRSVGSSCCHLTLRMTACGERQLKTKKENWRTPQSEICDLFHVSLSLEYNPSFVCFHQLHVTVYRTRQNTLTQSSKNGSCSNGVKYWMC